MSVESNGQLNDLLVLLHRSLVQYLATAWPWSAPGSGALEGSVLSLMERQQADAGKLAALLTQRRHLVDFGLFPADFTRWNFISLEYLYTFLCEQQHILVQRLEQSVELFKEDPSGQQLIREIAQSQRKGLDQLWNIEPPGESSHSTRGKP